MVKNSTAQHLLKKKIKSVVALERRIDSPLLAVGTQLQSKHFCSPFSCVLFFARTAQQQCCFGSLRESRCLAGINAARGGNICEQDASDKCGIDSYKASIYDQIQQERANTVHWVRIQT